MHLVDLHLQNGPPPGLQIVSASWAGSRPMQDVNLFLSNGEKHTLRAQWIQLVPAARFSLSRLSFHGEIRTSPWGSVAPGPWVHWRRGAGFPMGQGWTLRPRVGLYLKGTISYGGTGIGRTKKHRAGALIAGLRFHYVELGHVRTVVARLATVAPSR